MKKKSVVFIGFVLLITSITIMACGKGSTKTENDISLWHIQNTGELPKLFISAAQRFDKDNEPYKAKPEIMLNDAYKTKLKIALGANQEPDIFFSWTGGPMIDYIKAGKLLDLTPYMNKDNYKDKFFDAAVNQAIYEGKIWGVPIENTIAAMIFYNKELFEKHGWSEPKTISELES
ncbi:MAG: ABC transporter substrate-binding protein, partial [Treponemataceae bacterium]